MTDSRDEALVQARIDISRLEAQVEHLTQGMTDLREIVRQLSDNLATMNTTLSEAKGGWKTLMAVSGAAATAGAVVSKFLPHFSIN